MRYQYVIYEKKGHIAYVTINRPEVMNALHYDTNVELSEAFDDFKQDDESWVAIITGAGDRAFSAGNDLKATAAATPKERGGRISVNVCASAASPVASAATSRSSRWSMASPSVGASR